MITSSSQIGALTSPCRTRDARGSTTPGMLDGDAERRSSPPAVGARKPSYDHQQREQGRPGRAPADGRRSGSRAPPRSRPTSGLSEPADLALLAPARTLPCRTARRAPRAPTRCPPRSTRTACTRRRRPQGVARRAPSRAAENASRSSSTSAVARPPRRGAQRRRVRGEVDGEAGGDTRAAGVGQQVVDPSVPWPVCSRWITAYPGLSHTTATKAVTGERGVVELGVEHQVRAVARRST